ncbi:hypothetical protein HMPREF3293_03054 [Christensenella minuta]|uniref:Uncharacterized protein n=1 Tax=Christensenella minuta TaxID=626937 RepID=A0A136Q0H8_9FIRM|nr:hypothetical protein HMPREF3293_03054 [Christensenella minuta]
MSPLVVGIYILVIKLLLSLFIACLDIPARGWIEISLEIIDGCVKNTRICKEAARFQGEAGGLRGLGEPV